MLELSGLIQYSIHYHKGTPSCSQVVFVQKIVANNDIDADKQRKKLEKQVDGYDFNLLSQTSYLEKHGLAL